MIKQTSGLIFLAGLLITLAACTSEMEPAAMKALPTETITVNPEITPTIDICEPLDIPGVVFPRQEPVEGPREVMEAELVGDLVVRGGCLWVKSLYNDGSYLPIWPPEFTMGLENDLLVILDGEGNMVGRAGEEIYMGGGMGSENALSDCVREHLPAECDGQFWVVGEGVRPNLGLNSELLQMELITTTERTAILLHKKPILDEWVEEPAIVSGILRLHKPQRCPRVQSENGHTDTLPIWPPEYSLRMADGLVEILNGSGEVVAREGAEVVLHGGTIPHSWESENYRQLYTNIPGDCYGPYWIVGE